MPSAGLPIGPLEETRCDPFVGTPYTVLRLIGGGGMGEVFLVRHRELGRLFVAKVLRAELLGDPRTVDRVRIEAEALGQLSHPNIVSVTDFGCVADGRPFIVMEHLEGRTLDQVLAAEGALDLKVAFRHAQAILAALQAAHQLGIVHRDIKPQNLFLHEPEPGQIVLKVLDFGMARVLPGAGGSAPLPLNLPTEAGLVMGTPRFVSPEAAAGRPVDQRADLYAVGLMLYFMLTGRGPFDDLRRLGDLLEAHVVKEPHPPSHYAPHRLSPALDAIVLKALAKAPEDRFQSAAEFSAALAAVEPEHPKLAQGQHAAQSDTVVEATLSSSPPVRAGLESVAARHEPATPVAKSAGDRVSVGERPLLTLALFCASFLFMALIGASLASLVEGLLGGLR